MFWSVRAAAFFRIQITVKSLAARLTPDATVANCTAAPAPRAVGIEIERPGQRS